MSRLTKLALGALSVFVLVCAVVLAWLRWAPRQVPAGQPPLAILSGDSVQLVRDAFNASVRHVRLIAFLSPT